jgi:hypothetical protein
MREAVEGRDGAKQDLSKGRVETGRGGMVTTAE